MSSRFIMPFADVGSGIKPSSGAKLYFFETDGVTPKDTYSDQLSTPTVNSNPVVSDGTGVFPNIFIDGEYSVTLKDRDLSQIWGGVSIIDGLNSDSLIEGIERHNVSDESHPELIERLSSVESVNTTQDLRLDSIETINTEQDTRLSSVESVNATQDLRLDSVEAGQSAGTVGYDTQASLYADLAYPERTVAYVTNDPTTSLNGTYRKEGDSGAGSWVQSSNDLASQAIQNTEIVANNSTLGTIHTAYEGGSITPSGSSLVCAIPSGWKYARVGYHADLPAFIGTVTSTQCLAYDHTTNLLAAKGLASVDYLKELIVFSNLSGVGCSDFPDIQEQLNRGRGLDVVAFLYDTGSPPTVNYSTGVITFVAGNRLLADGKYIDLPVGDAPAIPSLNGLYYDSKTNSLSVSSVQTIHSTSQTLIALDFPELKSPLASLSEILTNQLDYSEIDFVSDNNASVRYSNDGSNNVTVTFEAGSRLIGGIQNQNYIDLPQAATLVNNLNQLVINIKTGTLSTEVIPSKYDKRYSTATNKIVLIRNFFGRLASSMPRLQSNIDGKDFVGVYVADGFPIKIDAYDSGTRAITFTFPIFRLGTEQGVKTMTSGLTVVLPQLKAVWLDMVNDVFISNVAVNEFVNDPSMMLIAYNVNGYVSSPVAGMQTAFDRALISSDEITYSVSEVTVGVGETYTTITDAFIALETLASEQVRYRVLVKDGTYNEIGQNGFGLEWIDYVYVYGQNKNNVIIRGPESPDAASTFNYDVIHKVGNGLISNVTLEAYKNKYAVHADAGTDNYKFAMQSVITRHLGSDNASNVYWDIGIGFRNSQSLTCIDVEMQGYGLRMHGGTDAGSRVPNGLGGWELKLVGCKAHRVDIEDFLEYYKSDVTLEGNTFDEVELWIDPQWYNAGAGNDAINRGWKNIGNNAIFAGNEIGKVLYRDAETLATLGDKLVVQGVSKRVYNIGGTIVEGQAVKREPNIAKVTSTTFTQTHDRANSWGGSGIFLGFAEQTIGATSHGIVQYSGEPIALASSAASAISYGDKLTLNGIGEVDNWVNGDFYVYALEDLAAGGGLLKVKLTK